MNLCSDVTNGNPPFLEFNRYGEALSFWNSTVSDQFDNCKSAGKKCINVRYESLIQNLDHTADRLASFMKVDRVQTYANILSLGLPDEFNEKQVTKLMKQEFKKLGGLHFDFLLFETIMSWVNQDTYEGAIFEHFDKYTMLKKLSYHGSTPKYPVPEEFAKEHKRLWKVYNLDRFASELELVYADKIIRYYINQ